MDQIIPTIAPELDGVVRLGLVRAEPVVVGPSSEALRGAIDACAEMLATKYTGMAPAEIERLQAARTLYRAFGVDPTRIRPSSEALLRRVLKNKPFPAISNAVDICNLSAIRVLLPPGLYDADEVSGPVTLRPGTPGESFAGIRKADVHLDGRPALVDEIGPFGNPSSDSLRTSVKETTRSLWMVVFAPASFPRDVLESEVEAIRTDMQGFLAGPNTVETRGDVIG